MRVVPALFLATALAVGATACGDDDDGPELTKAEFIAQADALCEAVDDEIEQLPEPADLAGIAEQVRAVEQLYAELSDDLSSLNGPDEDEPVIEDLVTALDEIRVVLVDLAEAAEDGDGAAVQEVYAEGEEVSERVGPIAEAYGFERCGIDEEDGEDGAEG